MRRGGLVDDPAQAGRLDAIDDRRIAGTDPHAAARIDRQGPDVLLVRIEEDARGRRSLDDVDLAVR